MNLNFESTVLAIIEKNKVGTIHFDDLDIIITSLLSKGYEVTSKLLGNDIVQVNI